MSPLRTLALADGSILVVEAGQGTTNSGCVYILIGNGDVSIAAAGGVERVNPTPSSPLFSAILLLELPAGGENLPTGFRLPRDLHETIAAGNGVYLANADGQKARLSRFADFVDYVPMPRPDVPENVQISNTFSMVGSQARFHIADAARNLIWTVGPGLGRRPAGVVSHRVPVRARRRTGGSPESADG